MKKNNYIPPCTEVVKVQHAGIEYYCHYGYELYNTWPQVIYKSVGLNNNSSKAYNINYL